MIQSNISQKSNQVLMGRMHHRNPELDTLKAKIHTFRVSDLQSLVGFFGRSRNGKKQELQNRVLEILRDNPSDINMADFKAKINELFRIAQEEAKHVHYEYSVNPRNPTGRGPLYLHQQTSRGGMFQNGSGFSNSSAFPGPSNPPSIQPPSNIACNLGDSVRILSQAHDIIHSNINFRPLPFYRMKHEIAKPTILKLKANGRTATTSQVFQLSFVLTCEIASAIAMSRDITKNEYPVQAQLRICAIANNTTNSSGQQYNDLLPLGLYVRMNDKQCALPPCSPCTRPGVEARRVPQPINVTQYMKLSPMNINRLTINWTPEAGRTFVLTLNVVEKLSSNFLLENLKAKPSIRVEETKQMIAKQYKRVIDDDDDNTNAEDDDIATTIVRVSLQCPLVKFRMTLPTKGKNCSHLQCFDGAAYISLNEKKSMWMCPVCNRSLYYDELLIDQYFVDVLKSDESKECVEVQLFVDGNWKVYDEECGTTDQSTTQDDSSDSPNEKLSSNSQDETISAHADRKHVVPDPISTSTSMANLEDRLAVTESVVDLTEDDEELVTDGNIIEEANNETINSSENVFEADHSSASHSPVSSPGLLALSTMEIEIGSSNYNPMVLSPSPSPRADSVDMSEDVEPVSSQNTECTTSTFVEMSEDVPVGSNSQNSIIELDDSIKDEFHDQNNESSSPRRNSDKPLESPNVVAFPEIPVSNISTRAVSPAPSGMANLNLDDV